MTICIPDTTNWNGKKPPAPPVEDPDAPTADEVAATAAYEAQIHLCEAFAWTTLQLLTAGRLAVCPIEVRPCGKRCAPGGSYFIPWGSGFNPLVLIGAMIPIGCACGSSCSCSATQEVVLPGPVGSVLEVRVDGDVVPATAYRVDYQASRGWVLVREDGNAWPYCQNMNVAAGEVGSFTVKYMHGAAPDELDNYAAGVLAYEFYLALVGDKACRLPAGVRSVTRNGVTYDIQDDLFEGGFVGISEVDTVIRRHNPYRQVTPSAIASPETVRRSPRVTTVRGF